MDIASLAPKPLWLDDRSKRMKNLGFALAALLLTGVGSAHAITITGSYSVSVSSVAGPSGTKPSIDTPALGSFNTTTDTGTFSISNLTVAGGETAAASFFTTTPRGSCDATCAIGAGGQHTLAKDLITVNFSNLMETGYATPIATTSTALADYKADYSNLTDSDIWRGATFTTTPPCTPSGKGVDGCLILSFTLPDGSGNSLNIILSNAADWAITPQIQFQVTQAGGHTGAPEPTTLALFGSALVGISLIGRRRRGAAR